MKIKVSIAIVLLSTVALIGVMTFMLNNTSKPEPQAELIEPTDVVSEKVVEMVREQNTKKPVEFQPKREKLLDEVADDEAFEDDDLDEEEPEDEEPLPPEDIETIKQVANLSEADLNKEIETLRARIESEDLFAKLEDGELKGQDEINAKQMLERFALLGLEGTRRKFMDKEPELKDPLFAHRESLKEIRELLSDD